MHYVKYKKWWDTKTFSQAGQAWMRDGAYCPFPEGTNAYYEYWDEQEHYIKNGFVHEGQRMTGLHYLYNNFCPIKDKKKKRVTLPEFWVIDAEHFEQIEILMGLGPGEPDPFRPHLFEESKTRQCGASLKGCVPILYNMNFVPHSQNYIGSWLKGDAEKTCQMFLNYFYHTQRFTEFGKRFIKTSDLEYYMTGYFEDKDGEKIPAGFQSELRILSFKDNPTKGVGGGIDVMLIEEAGLHPELTKTLKFMKPACKDGDFTTGSIICYGAAGGEKQFKALQKVHENPRSYDAMAYENKWEPDSQIKETGFFIPNYSCRKGHIDADGNPNPESAMKAKEKTLENLIHTDYEDYLIELSQFPNTPSEMFNNRGRKRFNTKLIDQQINFLVGNNITGFPVKLYENMLTKRVESSPLDIHEGRPIREYPLQGNTDKTGAIEIFEFPDPNPPDGLYIGAIDSYNQEDSYYSDSLGDCIIYKTINSLSGEGTSRIVVAEYTGRPKNKNTFYQNCADLIRFYNAVVMPENEDHELTPWFINNHYDHLLADQPDVIRGYIPNSKTKRLKGIHGDIHLIIPAENKIQRYIEEPLGDVYDEEGKLIEKRYGVSRILSLGLLYELKAYVHDQFKNFDRVRTFGWTLMMEEENYLQSVSKPTDSVSKFLTDTKRFNVKGRSGMHSMLK